MEIDPDSNIPLHFPNRRPNCLSFWFPKLEELAAGTLKGRLFVPKTKIIQATTDLTGILDGPGCDPQVEKEFLRVVEDINKAGTELGFPVFLRTGMGSGKHEWKDTCFLTDPERTNRQVCALIEWSAMVDMLGMPSDVWVVRQFLKGDAPFTAFAEMPVAREFRVLTDTKRVQPYWPGEAIERAQDTDWQQKLETLYQLSPEAEQEMLNVSLIIANELGGDWSVDWFYVPAEDRWYVTDMAVAAQSFRWEGRPNTKPGLPEPRPDLSDLLLRIKPDAEHET